MRENVLILLLLFKDAELLIKGKIGLELWCCGRFGPPYFTAKAKVTATARGHQTGGWVPTGEWAGRWALEEGKRHGRRIKKRGGVFCPNAHKKVTISQINPLSIVQPLTTSDPLFLSQCWNSGRRGREGARGNTPTQSQQWQKGASATASWVGQENKRSGHRHKAELPEAAHLHGLCPFPATPLLCISQLTIGVAQLREVPQHTQTHNTQAREGRGSWGSKESCCLSITDWPLSPSILLIGHHRKISWSLLKQHGNWTEGPCVCVCVGDGGWGRCELCHKIALFCLLLSLLVRN